MDVRRFQQLTDELKRDLGDALSVSNMVSLATSESLAAINPNRENEAALTETTSYMIEALRSSTIGPLGDYYMLDFPAGRVGFVIVANGYWWGIVVNRATVSMGMLFNAILPKAVADFKAATSGF